VLDRSPVGVAGETLSSDRVGKSVLFPLSTELAVFPLDKFAAALDPGGDGESARTGMEREGFEGGIEVGRYGTIAKNKNTAKIAKCTTP
jgi:hypothetical protein